MNVLHRHPAVGPAAALRGPEGYDTQLTLPLALGSLLNPINSSMIAVALVPIGLAFGAPPTQTVWLVTALYLVTAVAQPVVGRVVDLVGPRRPYLAGTALVGLAGLLGAFAPTFGVLVLARALLGLGTCAAYPAAMFLVRRTTDRSGEGRSTAAVLTVLAVTNQVVMIVGPTLGGLLVGLGGWRAIFLVNVPLAAACLVLGGLRLPRVPGADLDVGDDAAAHRFIDLRGLAGNRPLLLTYVRVLLTATATYAFMFGDVQWLEQSRGLSEAGAGMLMLPTSVVAVVVASATGRRAPVRPALVIGSVALLLGGAVLAVVQPDSPTWVLVLAGVGIGGMQGLAGLANQKALARQADTGSVGAASGLLRTFMYVGALVSTAAIAVLYAHGPTTAGLHDLALAMVACAALVLVLTLVDRSLRPRPATATVRPTLTSGETRS
ncbi:MFS transporter [Krasilnikoviella flava]|uniref:Predicted arabinose efflux permease, MFS family n=1 Tax=Krasilnikoviella flava TaxID=526729 RepID=A0A1T5I8R1_9MICO|nr:MFS transporter [Krasilnikoviella flava]SKC35566.1 Predicted arabinose efflux permease, MFS family [Krasilnikoviella flava]